ncbi:hypothetical protein ALON55S_06376 [Alishewanella longhuensis]
MFVAGGVDGVNLTLLQQDKTTVVALNERSTQFCRAVDGMVSGGSWQVQTRKGLSVQMYEYVR